MHINTPTSVGAMPVQSEQAYGLIITAAGPEPFGTAGGRWRNEGRSIPPPPPPPPPGCKQGGRTGRQTDRQHTRADH